MTTTGTYETTQTTLQTILDAAFRACRIVPQNVSAEMLQNSRACLQRMLNSLPAQVVPLWAQDHQLLPMTPLQVGLTLPAGTIDVVSAFLWTFPALAATATSAAGVTTYDLGAATILAAFALTATATGVSPVIDTSPDGIAWTTRYAPGAGDYAGTPVWVDLTSAFVTARYVRLTNLTPTSFVIAGPPASREVQRVNHEDFVNLPKEATGAPYSFWLHRKATQPIMNLWPRPDADTVAASAVSLTRQRYIQDVGTMTQTLELPPRWEKAVIAALAYEIAFDTPQVQLDVINMLKPKADEALHFMSNDETDSADMRMVFNLRGYTR